MVAEPPGTTIIANSFGANVVRGWLALAQQRPGDSSLQRASTVIFIEGILAFGAVRSNLSS